MAVFLWMRLWKWLIGHVPPPSRSSTTSQYSILNIAKLYSINHSRVLGNLFSFVRTLPFSVFRIIFSELLFLKCLLLHVSDIKVVLPGLSLGVEIYLVYSHIFRPEFVKYNSNHTRVAKRPACIIEIIWANEGRNIWSLPVTHPYTFPLMLWLVLISSFLIQR